MSSQLPIQSRKLSSRDEATIILFSANQNGSTILSSFAGFGLVSLRVYIGLYFEVVVYGKQAKKEATVISYFLMTSEWHP